MGRKPKVKAAEPPPPDDEPLNNLQPSNPYPDSALDSSSSIGSSDNGGTNVDEAIHHHHANGDEGVGPGVGMHGGEGVVGGDEGPTKKRGRKPKKVKNKRPKDMPTRPLSAYNYFFREERIKWLEEKPDELDKSKPEPEPEPGARKVKSRLFESMAKEVARRWKELTPELRQRYLGLAEVDMKRYRGDIELYQQRKVLETGDMKAKKVRKSAKVPKPQKESNAGPKKPPAPLVPGQKRRGRPPKHVAIEKAAAAAAAAEQQHQHGGVGPSGGGGGGGGRGPPGPSSKMDKASMMSNMQQMGGGGMHYGGGPMGRGHGGPGGGMQDDFGPYGGGHPMRPMGGGNQGMMKSPGYDQDRMHDGPGPMSGGGGHRGQGDPMGRSKMNQGGSQGGMHSQMNNPGGQGFDFAGLSDEQLRTLLEQQGQGGSVGSGGGGGRGQGGLGNFDSLVGRSPTSSGLVGSFGGGQSSNLHELMNRQLLQQQYSQQMMGNQLPLEPNMRGSVGMGGYGNNLEPPHLQQLFGLQGQGFGSSGGFGGGLQGMNSGFGDHSERGASSGSRRPSVTMTGGPGDDGGGNMGNNYQLLQLLAAQQGHGGGGYGGAGYDSLQNPNY